MYKKVFRPKCAPFIVSMALATIFGIGFIYLIIAGIIEENTLYLVVGLVVLPFYTIGMVKLFSWKVIFYSDYLHVPPSGFDWALFGKNKVEQKIFYSDIEKVELVVRPAQILFIQCKNQKKPNAIYIKQFSKKQVEKMIDEINAKTQL